LGKVRYRKTAISIGNFLDFVAGIDKLLRLHVDFDGDHESEDGAEVEFEIRSKTAI
jgi:hypothetical protein